jgi:hypothetical protein
MKTLFFLPVVLLFFILGCSENKKRKFVCKEEYLKDCVIIKIKKIQTTIQVDLDREKVAEAGISTSTLQDKLHLADGNKKLKTVKATQQFVIEGMDGKKHRLSEFAEIKLGIIVTYEEPWGTNPFNIQ